MRLFSFLKFLILTYPALATAAGKPINIPVELANKSYILHSLFFSPSTSKPGLVILTHGTPPDPIDTKNVHISDLDFQAKQFLKLGLAVLLIERRGYGHSQERFAENVGDCEHRNYIRAGQEAQSDIVEASDYARKQLSIDTNKIILAGYSAGGFYSIFAASSKPDGVAASINFSGGRGFQGVGKPLCNEKGLLEAYAFAGHLIEIPSLWLYSQNDRVFPQSTVQKMLDSFGVKNLATLITLPAFSDNGHNVFFDPKGATLWLPPVRDFLKKYNLCPNC